MVRKNKSANYLHIAVLCLLPLQLFMLTPAIIYLTNIDEMTVGLFAVLRICLLPCLISFLILFVIYKLCSSAAKVYWLMLLATTTFLFWLQGNVILWDYGPLDGSLIAWSQYHWHGWIDGFIWVPVFIVAMFFCRTRVLLLFRLSALVY